MPLVQVSTRLDALVRSPCKHGIVSTWIGECGGELTALRVAPDSATAIGGGSTGCNASTSLIPTPPSPTDSSTGGQGHSRGFATALAGAAVGIVLKCVLQSVRKRYYVRN